MYAKLSILGIVPARGGSKGVPGKNIRLLGGVPLVVHTLETARGVPEIDLLVVSTENGEIASISESCGVRVIHRPAELASDSASTESALIHVLDVLSEERLSFDLVLVLEPTAPLRSRETVVSAIQACASGRTPSVLAVRETRENLGRLESGCFRPILPGAPRRRQLREPLYIECGTIYAVKTSYLRETGTLVSENWGAIVVPDHEAVDLNTESDFSYAEFLIQQQGKERDEPCN